MKQGIFEIIENTALTESVYRMRLQGDTSAITNPGQFVNIQLAGKYLRRPISVCEVDGDVLTIGGATVQVWKLEGKKSELNDCSAQMHVTFGDRTILLAADLERTGQVRYVEWKGAELKADVLKYPHHGLERLEDGYLAAVSPLYFLVTNNQRTTEGKKYITRSGIPCAWTVPGLVVLTTDGTTWLVERIPSDVKY